MNKTKENSIEKLLSPASGKENENGVKSPVNIPNFAQRSEDNPR